MDLPWHRSALPLVGALLLQDVLVDGVRHGVGLGHTDLDLLHDLDGVGFLHLDGVGLLHSVRHGLLDDLGNDLVDGHLDGMLNGDVDWVGLGNSHFDVVGDGHGHRVGDGNSDLLVDWHGDVFHVLGVSRVHLLVSFIVGRVRRGQTNGSEDENGSLQREVVENVNLFKKLKLTFMLVA